MPISLAEKPGRPTLGLLQLWQLAYLTTSFLSSLLQTISKRLSPSLASLRPPFRPLLALRASSHQGQHQLLATELLSTSCSGRDCHGVDNFFQKPKSTPPRCSKHPVKNWHSSIKCMLSYTICNCKSTLLCI